MAADTRPAGTLDPPSGATQKAAAPESTARVIGALARFEGIRLVRHPAFLAGVALTLMAAATVGSYLRDLETMTLTLVLLGWSTVIAVDLAVLRSRRSGTDELLATLPRDEDTRTAGHLWSALAAGLVAIAVLGVELLLAARLPGVAPMPPIGPLAIGVIVVVGGGIVGVFAARWLPHLAFGYLAVVVTFYLQGEIGDAAARSRRIALAFVHVPGEIFPGFGMPTTYLAHALYLLALAALVAVGALARRRFGARLRVAATIAVVLVLASAWVQVRPLSGAARAEAAARLTDPEQFQTCLALDGTDYCAYESEDHLIASWADTIQAVLARAPADAGPRVERVTQRVPAVVGDRNCAPEGLRAMLPSEVSELAAPGAIWPDDGRIHPGIGIEEWECGGEDIHFFHLAVQAGSLAVGLPPTTHGERLRCTADGQARAVLALWLGAQAVPDGQRRLDTLATDEYLAGFAHLDFWGAGEQIDHSSPWEVPPQWGIRFLHSDLDAARRLHALPVDEVARLVGGNWDTLTAPSTPTAEFLTMAGLSAQESVDGGVPAPGIGRCP